jgi:hypothetical protein
VLLLASIAHAKLLYGDLEGTRLDMDAALKILDTLENVEGGVNAACYGVAADYYKVGFFFVFCHASADTDLLVSRPRRSMPRITKIRCSILRVWILRRICPPKNVSCGHTILVFRRFWVIRFITLVNWYVFHLHK